MAGNGNVMLPHPGTHGQELPAVAIGNPSRAIPHQAHGQGLQTVATGHQAHGQGLHTAATGHQSSNFIHGTHQEGHPSTAKNNGTNGAQVFP